MGLCNRNDQIWFGFHGAGCTQNLFHTFTFKQPINQHNLSLGTAMTEMGRVMMKGQEHQSETECIVGWSGVLDE